MKTLSALLVACSLALPVSAAAQGFPSKPLRFIVPFPGGFSDVLARQIGAKIGEALGQPVVVENRAGGSGQIGVQEVLRAPADGHTLFMGHIGTHAVNPHIFPKLSYDPDKDLAPVTLLVTVPNLLVVHPSVPAQNVRELIAIARSKPGGLSYASPGSGTSGHLAAELFKSLAGVFIVVRAGTPDAVLKRIHEESVKALKAGEVRDRLVAQGANVMGNTPEEFAAFIRAESARWGKLARQAGIRAD